MTKENGVNYLLARAAENGNIGGALRDVERYDALGDAVLRDQAIRTLDDLAFRRVDGAPAYTRVDVLRAASVYVSADRG